MRIAQSRRDCMDRARRCDIALRSGSVSENARAITYIQMRAYAKRVRVVCECVMCVMRDASTEIRAHWR